MYLYDYKYTIRTHPYICALHPTPEGQNILILSRPGRDRISKRSRVRSTRDTFQFGPECVARGFQTLFIMREEGVKLIKTSGTDPLRYYDIFDNL